MNPNLFLLFGVFLGVFISTFFLGKLIWRYYFEKRGVYLSGNFFIQFAQVILMGTVVLITLTSIYLTNFITVNLLTIPLLLLFPFLVKRFGGGIGEKESQISFKNNGINILVLFVVSTLIYLFHFLYSEHAFTGDFLYNSKLSQALVDSGVESGLGLYHNYISATGISLYHFGLLYLNSFFIVLTNLDAYELLMYVTHPFFHSVGWIAFMGLVYSFFPNRKGFSLLVSVGFFYGISSLMFKHEWIDFFSIRDWYYYGVPMFASTKMLILYPFIFVGFYYAIIKRNIMALMLLLSFLMVFYITIFVAIIGGALGVILVLLIMAKLKKITIFSFDFLNQILPFFIPVFTGMGMYVLNYVIGASHSEAGVESIQHSIYGLSTYWNEKWMYLKSLIIYLILPYVMYPLLLFMFVYSLLYYFKLVTNKVVLFLILCFIASGVFITLFEATIADSTQALSNILNPLVLVFALLLFANIKNTVLQKVILGITLFLCISNVYKQTKGTPYAFTSFEQELFDWGERESQQMPFFKWAYASNRYWSTWHINDHILRNPLVRLNNSVLPIEIAPLFGSEKELIAYCKKNYKSPICVFCRENGGEFSNKDINVFLNSLGIQYVYFEDKFIKENEEFVRYFKTVRVKETGEGVYVVN